MYHIPSNTKQPFIIYYGNTKQPLLNKNYLTQLGLKHINNSY